jgi:SAM-dependent methyltransferase
MTKYYPPAYYTSTRLEGSRPAVSKVTKAARTLRNRYACLGTGTLGRLLYQWWPNPAYRTWVAARFPGQGVREIGLTRKTRILDVGCGAGELLLSLREAGFRHLLGVDAYLADDRIASAGLHGLKRSIHEVTGVWDLVMFHHSFEHLPDPQAALAAAARLLPPGGRCLIRLPLVSSYAWEHYGVDWVQLDAPRHFFLHSEKSLRRLAAGAGFEITKIVYDSTAFQFVGSELYRRDIPLRSQTPADVQLRATAFSREEIAAFEEHARELNAETRGDQAAFYLTKPAPVYSARDETSCRR